MNREQAVFTVEVVGLILCALSNSEAEMPRVPAPALVWLGSQLEAAANALAMGRARA